MIKVGSAVVSLGGHDIGEWFIVVKIEGKYAFICDGKSRTIEKPKKKNLKHLCATKEFIVDFEQNLKQNNKVQNAYLRKTIKFFKEQY